MTVLLLSTLLHVYLNVVLLLSRLAGRKHAWLGLKIPGPHKHSDRSSAHKQTIDYERTHRELNLEMFGFGDVEVRVPIGVQQIPH